MTHSSWRIQIVAVLAMIMLAGCGGASSTKDSPGTAASNPATANSPLPSPHQPEGESKSEPTGKAAPPGKAETKVPQRPSLANESTPTGAPPTPDSPDAAVMAVLLGIREKHPEAVWDFLPGSMQRHLNEAVREFGRSIDAEMWNRSMGLLKKIVQIFETKKEFIFENPHWKTAERIDAREFQAHWDDIVGLCSALVNSELSDVERLKKFDGRAFLASTGAKVIGSLEMLSKSVKNSPFGLLADVKVKLKSRNGEVAVITIEVPGQPPTDHEFALLEGKWCPRSWVESAPRLEALPPMIAGVLKSDLVAKRKEVFMQDLDLVEQGINDLLDAKTAKEFNDYVEQAVIPFLSQRIENLRPKPAASDVKATGGSSSTTPEGVTVVVKGMLDEKAADALSLKLAGLSDNTKLSVVIGPTIKGETTEFIVTPVADVQRFASRLEIGKVVAVDAAVRSVTVAIPSEKPGTP